MIHFQAFLKSFDDPLFWNSSSTFCFQGQEFPSLFFAQLFQYINQKQLLSAPLQNCTLHTMSKDRVQATLAQSFLGSCTFYWLGNLAVAEKWHKELALDLCSYKGPNIVAYFTMHDSKIASATNIKFIQIDAVINYELFSYLQNIFGTPLAEKKTALIRKLFKAHPTISLDTACMLINYLELISVKMIPQSESYLFSLISTPPSLSQLSEYFFAKDAEKFFAVWTAVNQDYPDIFWITFWSEHLWRAFHVLRYIAKKDFLNAKKMSYRLPYSFLKKDWQLHTQQNLAQRFEHLYSIDYALKRGSTFPALDLFYVHHFQKSHSL